MNTYKLEVLKYAKMGREDFLANGGTQEELDEVIVCAPMPVDAGWEARKEEARLIAVARNARKKAKKLAKLALKNEQN